MTQIFQLHAGDDERNRILANACAFLGRLPFGKSFELEIRPLVKKRSDKQRRAMFGAAYKALMEFAGLQGQDDKDELHRFMCRKFFGQRTDAFGRVLPVRTTTRNERGERDEISVDEALRFYEFLQREGAQVGCYVPDPDPFWREQREAA